MTKSIGVASMSKSDPDISAGRHPFLDKEGQKIQRLFDEIAPRYDRLNRLFSFSIDLWWRRRAVRSLRATAGDRILDACCGTGDLAMALIEQVAGVEVIGSDFSLPMLQAGNRKFHRADRPTLVRADTMHLPFEDCTFDGAMVAFGMRNVVDLDAGLRELRRVLKPGGRLMILEFTEMQNRWIRPFSNFYQSQLLPRLGNRLSGSRVKAYSYLDESVRDWPDAERLADKIRSAPLHAVRHRTLFPGNVAVHEAVRG
ncbi:MAG: bifunctional demethylmenaquinone methyltransferase/2-methoxy-6-polyprenyl-1,4-benzoquinol methylase UbiE [Planctomycetota bacterium]|nr:bifunctional demethylmenaquinone methyltransferase/2-methoxy-6-polyprenyl-1,4-benzoquinol methylase UbiE [Planctomycetota bacterium]